MKSNKSIKPKNFSKMSFYEIINENPADKVFNHLKKNNNSFFEDDPNYLYEYLSRVNNKINAPIKADNDFKKKTMKMTVNDDLDLDNIGFDFNDKDFKIPNSEDSIHEYKDNLTNYMILKNKLKNDQFLIRKESDRNVFNKNGEEKKFADEINQKQDNLNIFIRKNNKNNALYGYQEDDKVDEREKIEELLELNKKKLEKENKKLKEKGFDKAGNMKMIQTYSAKEIEDYYNYKKKLLLAQKNYVESKQDQEQKILDYESKMKLIEKVKNKASVMNNNVILFKPSIYKSKKQQHYEMAFSEQIGNNHHLNVLLKNKTNFKDLEENEIKFKLENYERKVAEIENKNYIQKLEKLEALNAQITHHINNKNLRNQKEKEEYEKANDIVMDDSYQEEYVPTKNKKKKAFCEKVLDFFLGNPDKSYANKKHIWSGETRPYGKYFQDTRIFGDEYENQIAGEIKINKKEKK